ncbi:DUF1317 domain-containing protein [Erwinia sp. PK3-005]
MKQPTDNIRCGRTVIRYYDAYGGWMLPDKTITKNPLKAARIAEETEAARSEKKQAWQLYEIQYLAERDPHINFRTVAQKLDRTPEDVRQMHRAISAGS